MSVATVLPRFAEWEAKYGSLARAAIQARGKSPASSGPLFRTLKSGLATLTCTLAEKVSWRQAEAQTIERAGDGFRVRVNHEWIEAKNVVLACPAWAASTLVSSLDAELSARLAEIPYTSSATVTLGYRTFDGKRAGHGFLVPRKERHRLAACTFVNEKFPDRAPAGITVLRCFFGGAGDDAVLNEPDESLIAMAREELRRILGLTAAPFFHTISRWPRSMAQYTIGHAARWGEIEARVAAVPGLHIAGNGYTGIGIPDCIRMGRQAAARIIKGASVSELKPKP